MVCNITLSRIKQAQEVRDWIFGEGNSVIMNYVEIVKKNNRSSICFSVSSMSVEEILMLLLEAGFGCGPRTF